MLSWLSVLSQEVWYITCHVFYWRTSKFYEQLIGERFSWSGNTKRFWCFTSNNWFSTSVCMNVTDTFWHKTRIQTSKLVIVIPYIINSFMAIDEIGQLYANTLTKNLHVMLAHNGMDKAKSEYRSCLSKTERWPWVTPMHEPGHETLVVCTHTYTNYSCSPDGITSSWTSNWELKVIQVSSISLWCLMAPKELESVT